MSYDIFYRHQFIKLPDNTFLPYMEVGSSNCTQFYQDRNGRTREKRERSWWVLRRDPKKLNLTSEELLAEADKYIQGRIEYAAQCTHDTTPDANKVRQNFGYWASLAISGASTRGTTASMYRNLYVNGIKHAKTVEELETVIVSLNTYQVKAAEAKGKGLMPQLVCKTGEQLQKAIAQFTELYGIDFDVDVPGWAVENAIRSRPKKRKLMKERKRVDHFFAIRMSNGGYLARKTKWGFAYSPYPDGGKKFLTDKAAAAYAKRAFNLSMESVIGVNQQAFI